MKASFEYGVMMLVTVDVIYRQNETFKETDV